jgi:hypothetical protein
LARDSQKKPTAVGTPPNPYLIRFTAPKKLVGYLNRLARDTMLGDTAHEVALALLMVEAERRLVSEFHAKEVPTAEPAVPSPATSQDHPTTT